MERLPKCIAIDLTGPEDKLVVEMFLIFEVVLQYEIKFVFLLLVDHPLKVIGSLPLIQNSPDVGGLVLED